MKYQNIDPINKENAEMIFNSDNLENIQLALIAISFYEKDWIWAQEKCISFLSHEDITISGLAATCLGHIARVHKQLDKERVLMILKSKLENLEISGRIRDAIDDIEHYVE